MALRTDGNQRYSWIKNSRSLFVKLDPTAHLTLQNLQLMAKHGILCFKSALGPEERGTQVQKEEYQCYHRGRS